MDYLFLFDVKIVLLYVLKIGDGFIVQYVEEFCLEVKLLCDVDVKILDFSMDIFFKDLLEGGNFF